MTSRMTMTKPDCFDGAIVQLESLVALGDDRVSPIAHDALRIVGSDYSSAARVPVENAQVSESELIDLTCAGVGAIRELQRCQLDADKERELEHCAVGLVVWLSPILSTSRDKRRAISDRIQSRNVEKFPWEAVRPKTRGLSLLYNFSPFQDTGATVASKRIREFALTMDVIACSFLHKKTIDTTIERIAQPYINQRHFLPLNPSWASWEPFSAFTLSAVQVAEQLMESNGGYEVLYSRAMWAPSLFAGALLKLRNPDLHWIAEFSDPLSLDVEGLPRGGAIPDDELSRFFIEAVESRFGEIPDERRTIFGLCEYLAYAISDEIIFTNSNQREVMIEHIDNRDLVSRVDRISVSSNHPTLPSEYYEIETVEYQVDDSKLNLAYFGEFYSSRSITEVTAAMRTLPARLAERVQLHVFTNYIPPADGGKRPRNLSKAQFNELVRRAHEGVGAQGIEERVRFNASLPYLRFLATTSIFDYLIVNDAKSGQHHSMNPYLPSKWSDYSGSRAQTWAFVEAGSVLSTKPANRQTPVGDAWAARCTLWDMILEKFPNLAGEENKNGR